MRMNIRMIAVVIQAALIVLLVKIPLVFAGPYSTSAHGDAGNGVSRLARYVQGNCAHCHEQHASIDGSEPAPQGGDPSEFCVFSDNFDALSTIPYAEAANFCFFCHNDSGAVMQVINYNFAQTFGGHTPTTPINSILDAFNIFEAQPHSIHNLKDVQEYAKGRFDFFKDSSNPCAACHNPHRARRNNADPDNPTQTAISKPSDHESLWGDGADERMSNYTTYQPPYCVVGVSYEPAGAANHNGSLMPDYNAFCLDCHQNAVWSQGLGKNLAAIDWGSSGDMHGERARINDQDGLPKGWGALLPPYNQGASTPSNFVLSCMDCHEPHGSVLINSSGGLSSYLLRKKVNGNIVGGCGPAADYSWCQYNICYSCHTNGPHCGGPNGCFACHYHGAVNKGCAGPWNGPNF